MSDFHCGIRGFSKEAFLKMDLRTTGMEFASEVVIKATLMKMRLAEVPTTLSRDGRSRPPHLRPYRDGWRHLRFMLLFSPNWIFLYPGLILMAVTLGLGALLVAGPVNVFNHQLNVNTLIYCAFLLLIGFQGVMFAVLSRVFAMQENLYPTSPGYRKLLGYATMERGLILGLLLVLAGGIAALYTVVFWKSQGFGALELERIARIVIPAATALALGVELILFSFFLSTIGLSVRHYVIPVAEQD
jgi:hypothetical protein